jgi:hypothetical protein
MRDFLGHEFNPPPLPSRRSRSRTASMTVNASDALELALPLTMPSTPVKREFADASPHKTPRATLGSMEMVMERKSRQSKRDKRERKARGSAVGRTSPSPSPSRNASSVDARAGASTRFSRRVSSGHSPSAQVISRLFIICDSLQNVTALSPPFWF